MGRSLKEPVEDRVVWREIFLPTSLVARHSDPEGRADSLCMKDASEDSRTVVANDGTETEGVPSVVEGSDSASEVIRWILEEPFEGGATGDSRALGRRSGGTNSGDECPIVWICSAFPELVVLLRTAGLLVFFERYSSQPYVRRLCSQVLQTALRAASTAIRVLCSEDGELISRSIATAARLEPSLRDFESVGSSVDLRFEMLQCIDTSWKNVAFSNFEESALRLPGIAGVTFALALSAEEPRSYGAASAVSLSDGEAGECELIEDHLECSEAAFPRHTRGILKVVFYGGRLRLRVFECLRAVALQEKSDLMYSSLVGSLVSQEVSWMLRVSLFPALAASTVRAPFPRRNRLVLQLVSLALQLALPRRRVAPLVRRLRGEMGLHPSCARKQDPAASFQEMNLMTLSLRSESATARVAALAATVECAGEALYGGRGGGDERKNSILDAGFSLDERDAQDEGQVVALHSLLAVIFKGLLLAVPFIPDAFLSTREHAPSGVRSLLQSDFAQDCRQRLQRAALQVSAVLRPSRNCASLDRRDGEVCVREGEASFPANEEARLCLAAVESLTRQCCALLLRSGEAIIQLLMQRLNIAASPPPEQGDLETGPLGCACFVYSAILWGDKLSALPLPLSLTDRAALALRASCVLLQHSDPRAASAMGSHEVSEAELFRRRNLEAASKDAGLDEGDSRILLQRKGEQLFMWGASLLQDAARERPERFETFHSLGAQPRVLLKLILCQMASGSSSFMHAVSETVDLVEPAPLAAPFALKKSISALGRRPLLVGALSGREGGSDDAKLLFGSVEACLCTRACAQLVKAFPWSSQAALLLSLIETNTSEQALPDAATAAVLILLKQRWCQAVVEKSPNDSSESSLENSVLLRVVRLLDDRRQTVVEGAETLCCILNWLRLLFTAPSQAAPKEGSVGSSSWPFLRFGRGLLNTHEKTLMSALNQIALQIDAEEFISSPSGGEGIAPAAFPGKCLWPIGNASSAPVSSLAVYSRSPQGSLRSMDVLSVQRQRLSLVCFALKDVRSLAQTQLAILHRRPSQ